MNATERLSARGTDDKRRRDLDAIHAQAKQLGMDEDTRRALIERISQGRTRSSADLDQEERAALLRELDPRRLPTPAGTAPRTLSARGMLRKLAALLGEGGKPWSYAEAILRRQRGIRDSRVRCPLEQATDQELRGVIAALYRQQKRGKK